MILIRMGETLNMVGQDTYNGGLPWLVSPPANNKFGMHTRMGGNICILKKFTFENYILKNYGHK